MSYRCRVCRGVHPLRKCGRFLRLSAEKRLRAALINQYCPNCLAHEHSGRDCRSGDRCRHCHKHHHTLLHIPDTTRRRPTSVTPSSPAGPRAPTTASSASRRPRTRDTATDRRATSPRTSASSSSRPPTLTTLLQHRNPQVLPTASVTVDNGTTTYETRALIDPCRPMSAINASLAKAFHLRTSMIGDEEACAAVLRSPMSPDFQLEVVFQVDPKLHLRTPSASISDRIRSKFDHLTLADDNFHRPATVALILGADVYGDIIRDGMLPSAEGLPVAQHTVFGWTLSGGCRP